MMLPNPTREEILHVVMNLRDASRREIFQATDLSREDFAMVIYGSDGFKWVGFHEGKPAAILGASQCHSGVWSVFGFGTDDWHHIWRQVTRTARKEMFPAVYDLGAHRAHCTTLTESTDIHRWLKALGATEESVMRGYGKGGEDYSVFTWARD